jgi:hypothetical protein
MTWLLVVFILYPFVRYAINYANDKGDQALREAGFKVPYRKGQQGVPRTGRK